MLSDTTAFQQQATTKMSQSSNEIRSSPIFGELMSIITEEQEICKASADRETFFTRLRESRPPKGYRIEKAICLALGPLEGIVSRETQIQFHADKQDIAQQLLLFLDIVDFLGQDSGTKIPMYAQDPRFNAIDIEILKSFGIEILQMPAAERMTKRGVLTYVPQFMMEYQLLARWPELQPSLHVGLPLETTMRCCLQQGHHAMAQHRAQETELDEKVVQQAVRQRECLKEVDKTFDRFSTEKFGAPAGVGRLNLYIFVECKNTDREPVGEVSDMDLFNLTERKVCWCCTATEGMYDESIREVVRQWETKCGGEEAGPLEQAPPKVRAKL